MPKANDLVGKQLDQFRLDQFLARGAMGMVFRAFDTVLARTVALKLIPKTMEEDLTDAEICSREEAKKRLIQEAKAAGRLAHPNIVTIHSYGETEEFQYICMEYVRGKTLTQLLREQKVIPEEQAISFFEQILLALEAANEEDIIHRDIKPSNIMITDDNRIKVMDFGIAKLPSLSMTVTGMILGTPYYMSPEQISGKKVDIRSDIFSVGAVLYEILTGGRPFEGENTATLTYKIMQVDPTPPNLLNEKISQPMARIISRALAKDPNQRYQTPCDMLKDLRDLQKEETRDEEEAVGTVVAPVGAASEKTIQAEKPESEEPGAGMVISQPPGTELSEEPPTPKAPSKAKPSEESRAGEQSENGEPASRRPPKGKVPPRTSAEHRGKDDGKAKEEKTASWTLAVAFLLIVFAAVGIVFFKTMKNATPPPSPPPPTARPGASPSMTAPETRLPATQPPPPTASVRPSVDALLLEAGKQFVNNPTGAQNLLEEAISLDPNNFDSLVTLARLLSFKKDYVAAIQEYQKALHVNNRAFEAHYELGCLYIAQGNCSAAIQSLESSLSLSPPNRDEVLTNLGFCYSKTNKPQKAKLLFEQALQFNPKNETARALMASLTTKLPQQASPEASGVSAVQMDGKYTVEGTNPNGTKYHGTAMIKKSGERYTMTWNIANQTFSGNGTLSGKTLTINWQGGSGAGGVVIYTQTPGGVLKGVWANGSGSETLTPVR